jgi:hypothetical protein
MCAGDQGRDDKYIRLEAFPRLVLQVARVDARQHDGEAFADPAGQPWRVRNSGGVLVRGMINRIVDRMQPKS